MRFFTSRCCSRSATSLVWRQGLGSTAFDNIKADFGTIQSLGLCLVISHETIQLVLNGTLAFSERLQV